MAQYVAAGAGVVASSLLAVTGPDGFWTMVAQVCVTILMYYLGTTRKKD